MPSGGLDPKGYFKASSSPVQPPSRAEALCPHHLRGKGWNSRTFCFPEKAQVKFQGQKLALGLGKRTLAKWSKWGRGGWSSESPCQDLSGTLWVSPPHKSRRSNSDNLLPFPACPKRRGVGFGICLWDPPTMPPRPPDLA